MTLEKVTDSYVPPASAHERQIMIENALLDVVMAGTTIVAERDDDLAQTLMPRIQETAHLPVAPNDIRSAARSERVLKSVSVSVAANTNPRTPYAGERIIGLRWRETQNNGS